MPGSKVSFIFEADDRTGKATKVKIEEAATKQEEGPRETGTIKVRSRRLTVLQSRLSSPHTDACLCYSPGMRTKALGLLVATPGRQSRSPHTPMEKMPS